MSAATTRRTFLASLTSVATAAALPTGVPAQAPPSVQGLRFAFLPCVHLRRDRRSPEGFANALDAVAALDPPADFVLTGGDMCHNLRDQTLDQSAEMLDLLTATLKTKVRRPVHHCLGNHDLAAWNDRGVASDPRYGKRLTMRALDMPAPYYSFDHGGWHFVCLDYLLERGPGDFSPEFGHVQLTWLREDLARANGRPTVIASHAPIASAVELFSDRATVDEQARAVPFGRVVKDAPAVIDAVKEANVRAFVSGHLHLVEELTFDGLRIICSGSVSGQQWGGPRLGTPEGFGVFDCGADGSLRFTYRAHGWRASV